MAAATELVLTALLAQTNTRRHEAIMLRTATLCFGYVLTLAMFATAYAFIPG